MRRLRRYSDGSRNIPGERRRVNKPGGYPMTSADPSDATNLAIDQYEAQVRSLDRGQAIEALVTWTKSAYEIMQADTANPFYGMLGYTPSRFVDSQSDTYRKLIGLHPFRAWIYVASHEPSIARTFGESN